ncbi:MAG: prepilin-type N-terminal cleavage/methylation domain-containing protein [Synergistaceae bacterium]|nr:prepilin-type N-terminal cleavage/methylation domain-containing protein [Synergistaceae bacterium]
MKSEKSVRTPADGVGQKKVRRGFTLVEVMVAVAVLGLVAAGSLRLSALSLRGLSDVRQAREDLALSRSYWIAADSGALENRGREKDASWEVETFDFPGQRGLPPAYRVKKVILLPAELSGGRIPGKRNSIVLYVPELKLVKGRKE